MGDFPESEKMEEKVSDVMTRGMDLVDLDLSTEII